MTARRRFVRTGTVRLHVVERGAAAAPALVLVHGLGAHARWWDPIAQALADRFRVIAPDLRGHGDSGHVVPPDYSPEAYAADVTVLLDALGVVRPILVGHSLGGVVAMLCAARRPYDVGGVGMLDTPLLYAAPPVTFDEIRRLPAIEYPSLAVAARCFRPFPRETCAPPSVLRRVARHSFRRTAAGTWVPKNDRAALKMGDGWNLWPVISRLPVPIFVARGRSSPMVSPEDFAALPRFAPAVAAIHMDGGHHLPIDRPETIVAAIMGLVRGDAAPGDRRYVEAPRFDT